MWFTYAKGRQIHGGGKVIIRTTGRNFHVGRKFIIRLTRCGALATGETNSRTGRSYNASCKRFAAARTMGEIFSCGESL